MAIIKKNIWILFLIIFIFGFITLMTYIYNTINGTIKDYKIEQENITKITANSFISIFHQYETIMDIIIKEIKQKDLNKLDLELNTYKRLNNSIVSINLFKSNNNLKDDSFSIKRTYYLKDIKKTIIPITKNFQANNQWYILKVDIDMKRGFSFFINNNQSYKRFDTFLYRDKDRFFQFPQSKHLDNYKIYDYQVPKNILNRSIKQTEEKYNISIETIKDTEQIVTLKSDDERDVFYSAMYMKRYGLWIITQTDFKIIQTIYTKKIGFACFAFLLIYIFLYYMFRYINSFEKKKRDDLYYQATHDSLTNLYNRQFIKTNLTNNKTYRNYSIISIDIDGFKNINDYYGYLNGDLVLKQVAKRLVLVKNKNDFIVRFSADEFLIITTLVNKELLENFCRKILSNLSLEFSINNYKVNLTATIGVATFPNDGKDFDEVKNNSYLAMYDVKRKKNVYNFYNALLKKEFKEKNLLQQELKTAISKNEIFMVYQPKTDSKERFIGVEALVRWENEKLGFVNPEKLIFTAESIGYINTLGKHIIDMTLKETKQIQDNLEKKFMVSINISINQLLEKKFLTDLIYSIKKYNFDKTLLILEITESIFIKDIDSVVSILKEIRREEIKISLDDFGTGYSSLSVLNRLPINELKIDKSFINELLNKKSSENLVKSIINIAKEFNMQIVSEGVETKEQKDKLSSMKCDIYQGYYFSRPLVKDNLVRYLKGN